MPSQGLFLDGDFDHLNGCGGPVTGAGSSAANCIDGVHAFNDFAKHRVLGGTPAKPVEVGVVDGVDEELAASAVGSGVCHGERSRLVREFRALQVLVGDIALGAATGPGAGRVGILAVGTAELDHEIGDHSVEMQSVVEPAFRELHEVSGGDGHLVHE